MTSRASGQRSRRSCPPAGRLMASDALRRAWRQVSAQKTGSQWRSVPTARNARAEPPSQRALFAVSRRRSSSGASLRTRRGRSLAWLRAREPHDDRGLHRSGPHARDPGAFAARARKAPDACALHPDVVRAWIGYARRVECDTEGPTTLLRRTDLALDALGDGAEPARLHGDLREASYFHLPAPIIGQDRPTTMPQDPVHLPDRGLGPCPHSSRRHCW